MVLRRIEAREAGSIEEIMDIMDGASMLLMSQFVALPERTEHSKVDKNHAKLLELCMAEESIPSG